jgi:putative peptide-modifying radical SAM enzyme
LQYHLVLTERCNLNCAYCGGTRHVKGLPINPVYTIDYLSAFISLDPDAVIGFYGGEPTLAIPFMEEVMDEVPARAFTLQTNGTHLSEVPDDYLRRLHSILVSVDGPREVTDMNRGAGVYDRAMENLLYVEERGYRGDVVARMAVSRGSDIHRDVSHLLSMERPRFHHVHWQLDVFWSELDSWDDLESWLRRYDAGISRLIGDFEEGLREGRVLGIVPFIPVMKTLMTGVPTPSVRCGSGFNSFSIMTSGRVEACPIAPELPFSHAGDIFESTPKQLRGSVPLVAPCTGCDIRWVCGGRCLFSNRTKFWGAKWFDRVCETTRSMIEGLHGLVPLAEELMEEGVLPEDAFDYPEINNGCEIIP